MAIVIHEGRSGVFPCKRILHFRTADDEDVFMLSGIVMLEWGTENVGALPIRGTGPGWRAEEVTIWIRFPGEIPEGQRFRITEWVPFVALNTFSNDGQVVNAGWGVDEFWGPGGPPEHQRYISRDGTFNLFTRVSIRDTDGYLLRFGYHLTLKGSFEPEPPVDLI